MTSFKDYYLILELSNTATFDEIKSSYRRLSLLYHPDKNPGKDGSSRTSGAFVKTDIIEC